MSTYPPRRVLFVVAYLRGNDGITSHMMDLAEGLRAQNWEVAVASCMNDERDHTVRGPSWFENQGVRHFSVPFPDGRRPDHEVWDAVRAWPTFRRVLATFRPSLLHIHSLSLAPYAWVQRLLGGTPYVTTCHIQPHAERLKIRLGAQMNRLFPSFLGSGSVAVSSELHDSLRDDLHVPAERIRTIPYGTDASHFRPPTQKERHEARTELGVQPDEFVISVIGRLNPVKRQDLIVEATSQLRDRGVAATALIAGSGDWETALHGKIDEFGAHRYVKMLGFTDARKVLWASDALALPSSWESFGIVISEAMLCGVVPVRTPAAGARDQIQDGTDGFIVPFDNASAFAERFAYLAEQPEVRHRMSDAAQRSVRKRFTADIMTRDMLSLYEQTIDLGSASEHSAPSPPQPA